LWRDAGAAWIGCGIRASVPSISTVATNLLFVATPRQIPYTNGGPTQVAHHFCKATASACSSTALEDFQEIEQCLRADPLDAVIAKLTAHAL
jgi:hypothetical protein